MRRQLGSHPLFKESRLTPYSCNPPWGVCDFTGVNLFLRRSSPLKARPLTCNVGDAVRLKKKFIEDQTPRPNSAVARGAAKRGPRLFRTTEAKFACWGPRGGGHALFKYGEFLRFSFRPAAAGAPRVSATAAFSRPTFQAKARASNTMAQMSRPPRARPINRAIRRRQLMGGGPVSGNRAPGG